MAREIFGSLPTSVPKDSRDVVRVAFDEQEMGARKTHIPRLGKNRLVISHVKQGS